MNTKFTNALLAKRKSGAVPVVPDIKCRSPKEGDLLRGRDPVEFARLLKDAGAPALSVVTEAANFGGSTELLRRVVSATSLPVLRKDFITCFEDLEVTKQCGADAVLLMCAVQSERLLFDLYHEALRMGLEPLVETHTKEELLLARKLGARFIGINNRNILELERDDGTVRSTVELASLVPDEAVLISESSISTPKDAYDAIEAGADAVLVGTAIWNADDAREFYLSLCKGRDD